MGIGAYLFTPPSCRNYHILTLTAMFIRDIDNTCILLSSVPGISINYVRSDLTRLLCPFCFWASWISFASRAPFSLLNPLTLFLTQRSFHVVFLTLGAITVVIGIFMFLIHKYRISSLLLSLKLFNTYVGNSSTPQAFSFITSFKAFSISSYK